MVVGEKSITSALSKINIRKQNHIDKSVVQWPKYAKIKIKMFQIFSRIC